MSSDGEELLPTLKVCVIAALACVAILPSILYNTLSSHSSQDVAATILGIVAAILAPAASFSLKIYAHQRNWLAASYASIILALAVTYCVSNALGNAAKVREDAASSRGSATVSSQHLQDRRKLASEDLNRLKRTTQGSTVEMAAHEVAVFSFDQKWKRTTKCTDVTVLDSKDFCTLYATASNKLEAARRAADLEVEIRGIDIALEGRPLDTTADPQTANVVSLMGMFAVQVQPERISVLLNVRTALAVELFGAFGPMIFGTMVSALWPRRRRFVEAEAPPEPRELVVVPPPAEEPILLASPPVRCLDAFLEACTDLADTRVQASALRERYVSWCQECGHAPESPQRFAKELVEMGYEKEKDRWIFYRGLRLRP